MEGFGAWFPSRVWKTDNVFGYSPKGAFALCRVVKKNEHIQKMKDAGETKAERLGRSLSNGDFTSTRTPNEAMSIPNNESQYSSPSTSPYEVTPMAELEPALMETNPTRFWVSPDLILDSSKVSN